MAKKKPARKSAKKTAKSARPKAARKGAKKTAKKSARKTAAKRPAMKKAGAKKATAKKGAAKKTAKKAAAKRPVVTKSSGMRTAAKSTAKRPAAKRTAPKKRPGTARQLGHTVGEAIAKMAGKIKSAVTHESKPTRRPVASKPASSVETPAARAMTPSAASASSGVPATPAPMMPSVGDPAPGLNLRDAQGNTHTLSQYAGKRVVLYFYPKDDTPGCTTEACGFRNVHGEFDTADAVLLGISPDSPDSHARFAAKYGLPFTLLADEDHQVADHYGVWREKQNYGKTYMGVARTTFIIDENGRIARIFQNVSPQGHEGQVLAWLRDHQPIGSGSSTGVSNNSGEGGSFFGGI